MVTLWECNGRLNCNLCRSSNGNGDGPFSAPSQSFHFTYSDSAAAFVAATAVQTKTKTNTGESVSTPSRSFHNLLRFHCHFLPGHRRQGKHLKARKESRRIFSSDRYYSRTFFTFFSLFITSVKGGSYPEMSPQRNAGGEGFLLYLVANGRDRSRVHLF
jgi:hypothetical protein